MRTAIFTPRSVSPMHPRLSSFASWFSSKGITCDIYPSLWHPLFSRLNWLSLFIFDYFSVLKYRSLVSQYDIIIINDLKLLPLARFANKRGVKVIYDTIDHNPSLRAYALKKKFRLPAWIERTIVKHFTVKELKLSRKYCDEIIVNSPALCEYFGGRAKILFYHSPMENSGIINDASLPPALLYLGDFSPEKGASETISLSDQLGLKLFIFGGANQSFVEEMINKEGVYHTPKVPFDILLKKISELTSQYYLAGISIINPVHHSYATQEANKDIDYLSLGIPLIGNTRKPTMEKIEAGCGVMVTDEKGLHKLSSDPLFRKKLSERCKEYYNERYSSAVFKHELDSILIKYLN